MSEDDRNNVSIFVTSDILKSSEISTILGLAPSQEHDKGTPISYAPRKVRKFSTWELSSTTAINAENIDEHITYITSIVSKIPSQRRADICRLQPELKVVIYSEGAHTGINLSVEQLEILSTINASIDINVYNINM